MVSVISFESEEFNMIVQELKNDFFSRIKYPKLILGTGLSISYKLPGMKELATRLDEDFSKRPDDKIKEVWECKKDVIFKNGLEEGLKGINMAAIHERECVELIKKYTARFVLEEEIDKFDEIMNNNTGFKKMLTHLSLSVSANNPILDVMTPNYDRIVELVCDSLKINVVNGFLGHNIRHFNYDVLGEPKRFYNSRKFCVRLFKPHGSLDWIRLSDEIACTSDNNRLLKNSEFIEIITPGTSKYEMGLLNDTFRYVREKFNEILSISTNYSIVIFGYGFNDEHFNTVLYRKFEDIKALIISKSLKKEVKEKATENSNLTLIFSEDGDTYLIHRRLKFKLDIEFWNLDVFADIMF